MNTTADKLDRALEDVFRWSSVFLAIACALGGLVLIVDAIVEGLGGHVLGLDVALHAFIGFFLLACAVGSAVFAWLVVPDIRESTDKHPFLAHIVLIPAKITVFVTLMSGILLLVELERFSLFRVLQASAQILCALLASRTVWKLERYWCPDRNPRPLFGRWLEWKGARS